MITEIYGIYDERDAIRYIGKTRNGYKNRFYCHVKYAYKDHTHKGRWIRSMLDHNFTPIVKLLDTIDGDGCLAEMIWISIFRGLGARLTNISDGGDGGTTTDMAVKAAVTRRTRYLVWHTEETRAKMRNASIGKRKSYNHRLSIKRARANQIITEDTIAKISSSLRGRVRTAQHCASIRVAASKRDPLQYKKSWETRYAKFALRTMLARTLNAVIDKDGNCSVVV